MNIALDKATLKRFLSCLGGGFVMALMLGNQEGSQNDFGTSFRHATAFGRLLVFLGLGVVIFFLVSLWPLLRKYIHRPGAASVLAGFIAVLAAMTVMNWYDPVGKFNALSDEVAKSSGVPPLPNAFFGWLGWTLLIVSLLVCGAAFITLNKIVGYAGVVVSVASAVLSYVAHNQLVNFAAGIDHSLGKYLAAAGYLLMACGALAAALATTDTGHPKESFYKIMEWRPGLPIAGAGAVLVVIAFFGATWFAPLQLNTDFRTTASDFQGQGLNQLTSAYLNWLGLLLAIGTGVLTLVACYLRNRLLESISAVLGVVGVVLTFMALYDITTTAVSVAPKYGPRWQNLGDGGWVACTAFGLFAIAGAVAATLGRTWKTDAVLDELPLHGAARKATNSVARAAIPLVLLLAVFYPPTLPPTWQDTIVTQIGPYLLLAVGLNVVVGWAGLLDLGYIAFYAIGSYTTAYIVGALPVKPPEWLHLSPLLAIPFAIVACLIAGVILGFPTLRLRGDYLAIVTLGFGEIIQVLAINNPFNITGGPTGPNVRHPVLKLGPLHVTWGLDDLPYWYLLLILLIIIVILFYRLEGSRLGRAWAAIREDEVAAQATGINTTRAKLLAFAIGASTSGFAGVFFATQVGYFDPTLFTLQNSILIVAYVVFGGMGSLPGAIAGAAVLTWLPQFLKAQVPLADRQMWIGALVLVMMIYRPQGLIPARRRAAELHGLDAPASAEVMAVPASEGL
jgi:ABC-type branched-subunit amino acid transport system permease subunit